MPDSSAVSVDPVLRAVRDAFSTAAVLRRDGTLLRVVVALSGGRDSMALLDVLARVAPELSIALSAAHVHHGLSAHADS